MCGQDGSEHLKMRSTSLLKPLAASWLEALQFHFMIFPLKYSCDSQSSCFQPKTSALRRDQSSHDLQLQQLLGMAGLPKGKKYSIYETSTTSSPQQKNYLEMRLCQHLGTPESLSSKM